MARLPVFLFPVSLDFYPAVRHTHKQIMTIHNPYEFPVNFSIQSTSQYKLELGHEQGTIYACCSVDIAVRYCRPLSDHCDTTEKFLVTLYDTTTKNVLGKRTVPVKFYPGEPESVVAEANDSFPPNAVANRDTIACNHTSRKEVLPVNYMILCIGVLCIIGLMLPTQVEPVYASSLPNYLHVSLSVKLALSFVLGIVTMVLLKP